MPLRKPFNQSVELLRDLQLLAGDTLPELPQRQPRHDDEHLAVQFFRTCLADEQLDGLTLRRTFIGRSEVRSVSFRGTDLSESTACWNDFIDVAFDEADLTGADLRGSFFKRVVFRGAILRNADVRHSTFEGCTFTDADLTGAKIERSTARVFQLTAVQERSVDWQSEAGPEPDGG